MQHLASRFDMSRIEEGLLRRRDGLVQSTSWFFNVILIALIIIGFGYFLHTQYIANVERLETEKHIEFKPQVWLSATRNVRMEEYGSQLKPFEIEVGHGV
jgi:Tfp pilus assembly protein PilO